MVAERMPHATEMQTKMNPTARTRSNDARIVEYLII